MHRDVSIDAPQLNSSGTAVIQTIRSIIASSFEQLMHIKTAVSMTLFQNIQNGEAWCSNLASVV